MSAGQLVAPYDAALALSNVEHLDELAHKLGDELRDTRASGAMAGHYAGVLLRRAYEYYDVLSQCSPGTTQNGAEQLKALLARGVGPRRRRR